jgi:hypothetical protein
LLAGAFFLVLAPLAYQHPNSYDGITMHRVAAGIADDGNPLVRQRWDEFGLNTPYSGYGIGTSIVMAPFALIAKGTGGEDPAMNLASPAMVAATGIFVFATLRRRVPHRIAIGTTALIVVGSPLLAYAIADFSEPGVACAVAAAVFALDSVGRGARAAAFGAGAAVGAAVLFRTDSLLLVAPAVFVALALLSQSRRADIARFAAGVAPFLALWAWYNAARYGSPLVAGYAHQTFSHALWPGVYGLLLSPGRGILVYAPVLIGAFVVAPRLRGSDRVLVWLAVVMLALRVVFYARWWSWYGGDCWGPRFMLPILPAFAPALACAAQRYQRSRLFAVSVVASVSMAMIGVLLTVEPARNGYLGVHLDRGTAEQVMEQGTDPRNVSRVDHHFFDWSAFPFG